MAAPTDSRDLRRWSAPVKSQLWVIRMFLTLFVYTEMDGLLSNMWSCMCSRCSRFLSQPWRVIGGRAFPQDARRVLCYFREKHHLSVRLPPPAQRSIARPRWTWLDEPQMTLMSQNENGEQYHQVVEYSLEAEMWIWPLSLSYDLACLITLALL